MEPPPPAAGTLQPSSSSSSSSRHRQRDQRHRHRSKSRDRDGSNSGSDDDDDDRRKKRKKKRHHGKKDERGGGGGDKSSSSTKRPSMDEILLGDADFTHSLSENYGYPINPYESKTHRVVNLDELNPKNIHPILWEFVAAIFQGRGGFDINKPPKYGCAVVPIVPPEAGGRGCVPQCELTKRKNPIQNGQASRDYAAALKNYEEDQALLAKANGSSDKKRDKKKDKHRRREKDRKDKHHRRGDPKRRHKHRHDSSTSSSGSDDDEEEGDEKARHPPSAEQQRQDEMAASARLLLENRYQTTLPGSPFGIGGAGDASSSSSAPGASLPITTAETSEEEAKRKAQEAMRLKIEHQMAANEYMTVRNACVKVDCLMVDLDGEQLAQLSFADIKSATAQNEAKLKEVAKIGGYKKRVLKVAKGLCAFAGKQIGLEPTLPEGTVAVSGGRPRKSQFCAKLEEVLDEATPAFQDYYRDRVAQAGSPGRLDWPPLLRIGSAVVESLVSTIVKNKFNVDIEDQQGFALTAVKQLTDTGRVERAAAAAASQHGGDGTGGGGGDSASYLAPPPPPSEHRYQRSRQDDEEQERQRRIHHEQQLARQRQAQYEQEESKRLQEQQRREQAAAAAEQRQREHQQQQQQQQQQSIDESPPWAEQPTTDSAVSNIVTETLAPTPAPTVPVTTHAQQPTAYDGMAMPSKNALLMVEKRRGAAKKRF